MSFALLLGVQRMSLCCKGIQACLCPVVGDYRHVFCFVVGGTGMSLCCKGDTGMSLSLL